MYVDKDADLSIAEKVVFNSKMRRPEICGAAETLLIDEKIKDEAMKILKPLKIAESIGLGYLSLGQPTVSLSGGEAQRLKLVPFFSKKLGKGSVIILDEPTRGLHEQDVGLLLQALEGLISRGTTVLMVEHHLGLLQEGQWMTESGLGAQRRAAESCVALCPCKAFEG